MERGHEWPRFIFCTITTNISGTDEEGNEISFTVTGLENGIASLDGNHPLAGQALIFEVEIQALRDTTAAEIREGKAGTPTGLF